MAGLSTRWKPPNNRPVGTLLSAKLCRYAIASLHRAFGLNGDDGMDHTNDAALVVTGSYPTRIEQQTADDHGVLIVEAACGLKELFITERCLGRMQRAEDHWAIASDMNSQLPLNRQVVITADEGIDGVDMAPLLMTKMRREQRLLGTLSVGAKERNDQS
mgnify:CR=1 FL=1